ncbi:hypothetical protein BC829DRAFT_104211 [Chytridium lagenaria]|nr:hypothetical protein BC829DRAFT_104211 [Chytridium lagenaria]
MHIFPSPTSRGRSSLHLHLLLAFLLTTTTLASPQNIRRQESTIATSNVTEPETDIIPIMENCVPIAGPMLGCTTKYSQRSYPTLDLAARGAVQLAGCVCEDVWGPRATIVSTPLPNTPIPNIPIL